MGRILCAIFLVASSFGCDHDQYIPASLKDTEHEQLARLTGAPYSKVSSIDGVALEPVWSKWDIYVLPGAHDVQNQFGSDAIYLEKGSTSDIGSDSLFATPQSQEGRTQLGERKALVEVVCPTEITRSYGRWQFVTEFHELGGKIGYTLHGTGYILDSQGNRWVPQGSSAIDRGQISVAGGRTATNSYWCSGDNFLNGYACFTWDGADAKGKRISVAVKVHLLDPHSNYPLFRVGGRVRTRQGMTAGNGASIPVGTLGTVLSIGAMTDKEGQQYSVKWDGITIPAGEEIGERYLADAEGGLRVQPPSSDKGDGL